MTIIEPKILSGTREFGPLDMAKRNFIMDKIKTIFASFGYDQIETPVLNYAEQILGKYGEEGTNLTYTFEDNGGRKLALPYDSTVPFARFFAANWGTLPIPFKRFQIQKAWRAEKAQKGRLREFYQCDVDVIGTKSLVSEAEIAKIMSKVFPAIGLSDVILKLNSRALVNDILRDFGVQDEQKIKAIRSIDKLAKIGEEKVALELSELGISDTKGLLNLLKPEETLSSTMEKLNKYDLSEIKTLLDYMKSLEIPESFYAFDPSLARGLDYYTGIIFEVTSLSNPEIGSICGGGRYDNLCGLFSREQFSGVGVAFGFERIMIILEGKNSLQDIGLNSKALVTIFNEEAVMDSLRIYSEMQELGINSELYFEPANLKKQFTYANKKNIPFVIVQGPDEKEKGLVSVKNMKSGDQKFVKIEELRQIVV